MYTGQTGPSPKLVIVSLMQPTPKKIVFNEAELKNWFSASKDTSSRSYFTNVTSNWLLRGLEDDLIVIQKISQPAENGKGDQVTIYLRNLKTVGPGEWFTLHIT